MTWIIPTSVPLGQFAQQGWQCPCCRRVYSPTTSMCFSCGNQTVESATGTSGTRKDESTDHQL